MRNLSILLYVVQTYFNAYFINKYFDHVRPEGWNNNLKSKPIPLKLILDREPLRSEKHVERP